MNETQTPLVETLKRMNTRDGYVDGYLKHHPHASDRDARFGEGAWFAAMEAVIELLSPAPVATEGGGK